MRFGVNMILKKVILILFLNILLLLCSCSLFHKHEFGEWQTESMPDCVNEGLDARYCECGERETRTVAALGHTEKVITGYASSCSKTGLTDGKYCTVCRETTVEQETIAKTPHTEVIDYGRPATCENEGLTDGKHCEICGKVTLSRKKIDKLPHNEITVAEIPATCQKEGKTSGSVCSECGLVFTGIEVIPKIAHTVVIDHGVPATCTSDGISEGSHCSACGEILVPQLKVLKFSHAEVVPTCTRWGATYKGKCELCNETLSRQTFLIPKGHDYKNGYCTLCGKVEIDFTDVSLYKSTVGYDFLATYDNGTKMQAFYEKMESVLINFHCSKNTNAPYYDKINDKNVHTIAVFNYADFGVTKDEAIVVFMLIRQDNPALYWLYYTPYCGNKSMRLITLSEFANGADRARYNDIMYQCIEEYYALADGLTDPYEIALAYFDAIVDKNEYSYVNGTEANDSLWAHSVIGGFVYNEFVCEGYAKLFQLLLNLHGVNNIYITGDAGGGHAWNLVEIESGKWYWCDPTWADNSITLYKYFCATDKGMPAHVPNNDRFGNDVGVDLPKRSVSKYNSVDILEIGEQFKVGNSVYKRSSATGVKLVSGVVQSGGRLVYNGVVYQIER